MRVNAATGVLCRCKSPGAEQAIGSGHSPTRGVDCDQRHTAARLRLPLSLGTGGTMAVKFRPCAEAASPVASGANVIVDVEFGPHHRLYALSQGFWDVANIPDNEGAPASPNSGSLVRVRSNGQFKLIVDGLDRSTSLEFIGHTAYVVTLTGKVLKIDHLRRHHR
jgi:hypothetical protein